MEQPKNEVTKIQSVLQLRYLILISLVLITTGFTLYCTLKFSNIGVIRDIQFAYIPIIIETIGVALLFIAYNKEVNVIQDQARFRYLKRYTTVIGVLLVTAGIITLTFNFLIFSELTPIYALNEGLVLVFGVVLVLRMYLNPEEEIIFESKFTRMFVKSKDESDIEPEGEESETSTESSNLYENDFRYFDDLPFHEYLDKVDSWDKKLEYRILKLSERLETQKRTIHKQANVNLTFGIAIAVSGIIALLIIVQMNNSLNPESLLSKFNYFSRLSLVIFVELLAIFFLKLYKENLNEKRYYQNELTNIELKYLALITARESEEDADMTEVIKDLSKTERNFILKKGESTVHLKNLEIEASQMSNLTDLLSKMLGKK